MLTISIEFLHGTLRAASADDTALSGAAAGSGEWPPSPARLFAALVAADGTRQRCAVTDGSELVALEAARPPRILASPPDDVLRSSLRTRYVVVDDRAAGSVQEYPGRVAAPLRPGERLAPRAPHVSYVWDDLHLASGHLEALVARAARVGYLGCADHPARLRVSAEPPELSASLPAWRPEGDGSAAIPVPYVGLLDELDVAFERWVGGEPVRRAWVRTVRARYRPPGQANPAPPRPVVLWLRLEPAVSGRKALAVAETLRDAVLNLYTRFAATGQECPAVLHGHGLSGPGYQHTHWLVLPDVGHRHAAGRIHGAAVWLPPATEAHVVEGVRSALWRLAASRLVRPGSFDVRVRPHEGEERPWAAAPRRWEGPARRWISALPVVHERWLGRDPDVSEVARWCRHADATAEPVAVRTARVPLVEGALALRPHEVRRTGREPRPFSHLEVTFDRRVRGPLVLGRMRQFGLGLMAPVDHHG